MREKQSLKHIVLEVVVFAILIGFIPDLYLGGIKDLWGVCGFADTVCNDLRLQGIIQLILALVFSVIAVCVAFVLSKEYNSTSKDNVSVEDKDKIS